MKVRRMLQIALTVMNLSIIAATPQVKNVKAFQQYPWANKVYISYEVEGDIAASTGSGTTPSPVVTVKDETTGMILCESVDTCLSGDTGIAAGIHKVVWDIDTQGISLNSTNAVFTVMYRDDVYLVVDLSAGASASSYSVSNLGVVPWGGWTDAHKTTKLVLRRLPAGTYKMQNISNVTLTQPFYMGVFEVTQKQWELVMGSNPCSSTSYGTGDSYPVHSVSYDGICSLSDSFLRKLRARTGLAFGLPTEAQWEYACRAGTTTTYYWGDSMNGDYAWYNANSGGKSHAVGTKAPNFWGLYDMIGNVAEFCSDWSGPLSYGTDPYGPYYSEFGLRVIRGGYWRSSADGCTSSFRYGGAPSGVYESHGFRLVLTLAN